MVERLALNGRVSAVEQLSQLFQKCPHLRDLELREIDDKILECIGRFVPQLEIFHTEDLRERTTATGWLAFANGSVYPFASTHPFFHYFKYPPSLFVFMLVQDVSY